MPAHTSMHPTYSVMAVQMEVGDIWGIELQTFSIQWGAGRI